MRSKFVIVLMSIVSAIMLSTTVTQAATTENVTANNSSTDNLGIKIDGNFDDWKDMPSQDMFSGNDKDNAKHVSLVTDSKNIYIYVLMHPVLEGGYTNFQPSNYDLTVGGKVFNVSFNNHSTVNLAVGQTKSVPINIWSDAGGVNLNDHAYVGRQNIDQKRMVGNNKSVTVVGQGYVFEAAIPFKDLHGISNTSDQMITLANQSLWTGKVNATGGSTGPVLLAGTGVVIALFSVLKLTGFDFKKFKRN